MDRGRSRLYDLSGLTTTRPSTPIEIPLTRHIIHSPSSSINCSTSPDLVFDMSPLSYELSTSPHYPLTFSQSDIVGEKDPFMYSFPVYSPLQKDLPGRVKENNVLTNMQGPFGDVALKTKGVINADKASTASTPNHSAITTKIIGFVPLKQSSSLASNQPPCTAPPKLSLSPRRLSLSSTPSTPPMKLKENILPCVDFEKHLFRRIDAHRNMSYRLSMGTLMRR